jgi:hypothetical protein
MRFRRLRERGRDTRQDPDDARDVVHQESSNSCDKGIRRETGKAWLRYTDSGGKPGEPKDGVTDSTWMCQCCEVMAQTSLVVGSGPHGKEDRAN